MRRLSYAERSAARFVTTCVAVGVAGSLLAEWLRGRPSSGCEGAMARRELVIHLAHGEPRLHLWCDRCLTSARYEVDLCRLAANGPRQMGTIRRCHRCDVTTMPNDTIAYTDDDDA